MIKIIKIRTHQDETFEFEIKVNPTEKPVIVCSVNVKHMVHPAIKQRIVELGIQEKDILAIGMKDKEQEEFGGNG